jgi:pimeloyl-ACP methyl ester carboxylesterase
MLVRCLALLALALGGLAQSEAAQASDAAPVQVSSDVSYELIGGWDVEKLNQILTVDAPKFFGVNVAYTPARNGVKLYRVTYASVIPERGNKPTVATGLLAVPDTGAASFPILSHQHGTVYGKDEVPSFPDQSPETQLMLAQFAGQGYVVIAADYFGMGQSREPEGYVVKASHQQASYDLLVASRAVLAQLGVSTPKLFLGGWSQGGFATMAFLEKLEDSGVPVSAAATASAPVDAFALISGALDFPRKNDAPWLTTIVILSAFSFENYYGVPGLARSVINDAAYDAARKLYEKQPVDSAEIPTDLRKLVRADYFDPQFFAASAYGRLLAEKTTAYRWVVKSPVRNYYGEADEAIPTALGQLAMTYQHAMGAGNMQVEAISTGETDHRGTFATAAPQWKVWFDGL